MSPNHPRNRLTAAKEPVTGRRYTDITVQRFPENFRDIKLPTYKERPDFNLSIIQATICGT